MRIPWYLGADLRDDERTLIGRSIAIFQLGESGEGRHLFRFVRAWAQRSGDDFYCEAARLHIAEEGRHSAVLRRFMNLNDIAALQAGSSNAIFKALRNALGSLEISITVLVSAELIAKVYYPALREATQNRSAAGAVRSNPPRGNRSCRVSDRAIGALTDGKIVSLECPHPRLSPRAVLSNRPDRVGFSSAATQGGQTFFHDILVEVPQGTGPSPGRDRITSAGTGKPQDLGGNGGREVNLGIGAY